MEGRNPKKWDRYDFGKKSYEFFKNGDKKGVRNEKGSCRSNRWSHKKLSLKQNDCTSMRYFWIAKRILKICKFAKKFEKTKKFQKFTASFPTVRFWKKSQHTFFKPWSCLWRKKIGVVSYGSRDMIFFSFVTVCYRNC